MSSDLPSPRPARRTPARDLPRALAGLRRAAAGLLAPLRPTGRPLPRGATEMRLRAALGQPGCPVCRVTQGSADAWIFWFLHENHMEPEVLDALSASLGFCPAHGEGLLSQPSAGTQIATVHRVVVQRLRARWRTERGFTAWEAGVLRAGGPIAPCPACRAADEAVRDAAGLLARVLEAQPAPAYAAAPARLCPPHLRRVGVRLSGARLERVLAAQESALGAALDEAGAGAGRADVALAAGQHPGALALPQAGAGDLGRLADPVATLERDMRSGTACPICLEVRRAWVERLSALEAQAGRDAGGMDDLLPTCPEHVWATWDAAGPELARATRARALDAARKRVRQALQVLQHDGSERDRRGVLDRLAGVLRGHARVQQSIAALTRGLACPACTRIAAARDRTLLLLFALLEQQSRREVFESGHGLCLPHLAQALALRPAPSVRACLRDATAAKLAVLEWELAEHARKSAWIARAEPGGTEQLAPVRAVHRCSGCLAASTEPAPRGDARDGSRAPA